VLLDLDGTLIDSNDAHAQAFVEAFAGAGFSVPFERVRRLIGKGGDKLLREAAGLEEDAPPGCEIAERKKQVFMERFLPNLRPFPQVRELLERMRGEGLRLVVASSAGGDELEKLLESAGVADLMQNETSGSEVKETKPDPDILQAALKKIGLPPEQVLMLGDTPYDLEAAQRAGVGAVAFRSGGWGDADLDGALAIYQDAADLLRDYARSPFAR
jgi:HAD superfamily hydrolase (TIGR01509 family)